MFQPAAAARVAAAVAVASAAVVVVVEGRWVNPVAAAVADHLLRAASPGAISDFDESASYFYLQLEMVLLFCV